MRVMISQPMNGKTEEQIRAERKSVIKILEAVGHKVIDTVFAESPEEAQNAPLFYLAKSIDAMSRVDAVFFMDGWESARGCKIEHDVAVSYNVPILYGKGYYSYQK